MNKLILIIAFVSFLLWPVRFFLENNKSSFAIHHVFESDYQAQQLILRNINLYPNVPLARFFQNKLVIISNKYFDNLFDFIDPNYYFFGSHPREVVGGQNYTRLPLLTFLPILFFFLKSKVKFKKSYLLLFLSSVLVLSFITNHYLFDFVLWPFVFLAIYLGSVDLFKQNRFFAYSFFILLMLESLYELSVILK